MSLPLNIANGPKCRRDPESEVSPDEIARWQRLFHYSHAQATSLITEQKSDYTRHRISDHYWQMIRQNLEDQGYNCSAYDQELDRRNKVAGLGPNPAATLELSAAQALATYIVKLHGPLRTAEDVKAAAGIVELPQCVHGEGNEANATFCTVDGAVNGAITRYLAMNRIDYAPMFARVTGSAEKNLSADSIFPTLGVDSTLPRHRAASQDAVFEPTQEQYPVMYFFSGTLADSDVPTRHLGLSEEDTPMLRSAEARGGRLEIWAGKYNALVDALSGEVVRCGISVDGRMVEGCTFRFRFVGSGGID